MCHVLCVWDALVVLFWLPSLPHFWQKVITCEVEHFVSLIASGRSSNLENASGSPCIMITKKKMYQLDKLKYQPLFCNVVISERKFPSSSLQWGGHRNYWYLSPGEDQWGMKLSMRHKRCQVSLCKAGKEAIWGAVSSGAVLFTLQNKPVCLNMCFSLGYSSSESPCLSLSPFELWFWTSSLCTCMGVCCFLHSL